MITLKFEDAKFQRDFHAVIGKARRPRAIMLNAGREVANQLKAHFRNKDRTEANHLSGRRAHFWQQIAQSVNSPVMESDTSVSVTISDPRFAQKLFGGEIHAKNAGALTIPVEERAYGRTAATFERETGLKLFLVKIGGTKANGLENTILAVKDPLDPGKITVEYVLTKSVTQPADTDALPPKSDLETAILVRAQKDLDRENQNPTSTGTA